VLFRSLVSKMVKDLHISAEEIVAETGYTTSEVDNLISKLALDNVDLNPGLAPAPGEPADMDNVAAYTWAFTVTAKQNEEIDKAYRIAVELLQDTSDGKVLSFICKEFMESLQKKGTMPAPKPVRKVEAAKKGKS